MISTSPADHARPRADDPFISVDVPFELARLRASREFEAEGHAGRTLTKRPELRTVLQTAKSGVRLPLHETAEQLTLQVLLGQLRVWLQYGENCDFTEGSFVAIDAGRLHEIEVLEDCAFLLTLAWPPVGARAAAGTKDQASRAGI